MRIQLITSGRRPNDGSTRRSLDTNNLLGIFPRCISLNRITSDHIYSATHTNQTTENGNVSSDSDVDSLEEGFEDPDNETPIKPRVITHCVTSRDCLEISSKKVPREEEIREKGRKLETLTERRGPLNNYKKSERASNPNHEFERGLENEGCIPIPNNDRSAVADPETINTDNDMLSLNADSIQKVFQNTIYMTSFMPIGEGTNRQDNNQSQLGCLEEDSENIHEKIPQTHNGKPCYSKNRSEHQSFKVFNKCVDRKGQKCVKLRTGCSTTTDDTRSPNTKSENDLNTINKHIDNKGVAGSNSQATKLYKDIQGKPMDNGNCGKIGPVRNQNNCEISNKGLTKSHNSRHINNGITNTENKRCGSPKPTCQTVNDKEYREISRDLENDRELGIKISYTLELLVKKWSEYLTLTADQIREMEVQNAKEMNMVGEVIDMLEDNDRYVWELVDELKFF